MQFPVIGITGLARSGKDTVANFALAEIGGYRYSFAEPIYNMVAQLGIDFARDPYWHEHKEDVIPALGVSPRRLLQTLGTEWGREIINPNLWLIMAKQRLISNGRGMIISDVRFENEAAWVRAQGGLIIHVCRTNAQKVAEHQSENGVAVADHDRIISNNGSLEELQARVKELVNGR